MRRLIIPIVVEKTDKNYSSYAHGLPGFCCSVGDSLEELKANMREAILLHLEENQQSFEDPLNSPITDLPDDAQVHFLEVDVGISSETA